MNYEICRYIIIKFKNNKVIRSYLDCIEDYIINKEEFIFMNNHLITENQYYEDAFSDLISYKKIKLRDIKYAYVKCYTNTY
jgi:hypothetical protein